MNIDMHRGGEASCQATNVAPDIAGHPASHYPHPCKPHITALQDPTITWPAIWTWVWGSVHLVAVAMGTEGTTQVRDTGAEWGAEAKSECPCAKLCIMSCIDLVAASLTLLVLPGPALPCSCKQHVLESGGQRWRARQR